MFFQSPKPFGQHSKSYRSMGSNMRSSTSMTNLQKPDLESGRASAPPTDFASVYENRLGPPAGHFSNHISSSGTNSMQTEISRGPGFVRIAKKQIIEDRSIGNNPVGVANRRVYQVHKTTSLQDTDDLGRAFGPNFCVPQSEVFAPSLKRNAFPVQRADVPNKQPPPWVRQAQRQELQPEQAIQNVEEFQRKATSYYTNRFRSNSAIPFSEYNAKETTIQQVPIASTNGQPIQETENSPETRIRNAAQFVASELFSNEHQQQKKPTTYQQLERRKNYATLHHVAPPRMGPLQRRISDPNLLKIDDKNQPENIAMFNVAKEVRAELEQDPKFRQKADTLSSGTTQQQQRAAAATTFSSAPPSKELPKQSPSLRQMENFFENAQQFRSTAVIKEPPPVPLPKPFNVEHVRSIFRTTNSVTTESPAMISSSAFTMHTQTEQNNPILEKGINSVNKMQKVQDGSSHAKTKEGVQTFRITSRTVIDHSRNTESTNSSGKSAEQKNTCSTEETNGQGMLKKSTLFVADKSVNVETANKSVETPKTVSIPLVEPMIPQDISILEKDYSTVTKSAASRHLRPFPVDETTVTSGDTEKSDRDAALPGILLKNGINGRLVNDSVVKTQKRVVFQCDMNDAAIDATKNKSNRTSAEVPSSVMQYDDAVNESFQRLLKLSNDIGGDLQTVGNKLSALFNEQRDLIWLAAGQKELPANELQAKLGPLVKLMEDLSAFKESKRNTPFFNHISAASEGVQALGWLTVKPTPAPYIKDMLEAAMFFINRVLKEHKDDKVHTEWAKCWSDVLNALQKYVRQVHTTGLVWNSCPGSKPPASAKQGLSGGTPPPPPPPIPSDLFAAVSSGTGAAADKANVDRTALFAEINAGEEITKRLKKVTPDMQTHKNPALRSQHDAIPVAAQKTRAAAADGIMPTKKQEDKPPKTWLENGKQWNVEYHKNNKNVVVDINNMKQTVYVFKCENSVVQVKGKVNSITLDSCKKTSIVFDSLLSQIEVINCQGVQIQTLGAMPTLSIQKTDGCQVYLSKDAMNAEIITSKSSEMNVLVPAAEDDDFVEFPIPEQFKTVYDGKKLQTTVSDIC